MGAAAALQTSSRSNVQARGWLALALLALLVGGALSLVLIVSRVPGMTRLLDAPLLAKKSLVVHVNLVLTVWFVAFIVALFSMIAGTRQARAPIGVAALGIVLFVASGLAPGAEPILSNYVPMLDQPVFIGGLCLFCLGAVLALVDRARLMGGVRLTDDESFLSAAAVEGLRVAAWLFALALLVLLSAVALTLRTDDHHRYWEAVFWGAGHVLQFVFLAAMLSVWVLLVRAAAGRCPLGQGARSWLVFALVWLPALPALWLLGKGPDRDGYYALPTEMMRWGTWPAPALTLLLSLGALRDCWRRGALAWSSSLSAWSASVVLLALGIGLGAFITRSSTLVPAHYHATVGAVTVALMGASYLLLDALGLPLPNARLRSLARWQPLIFGLGQVGFATGFAYAGWHGLGRKVYGHEQAVRGLEQSIGLGVMGVGGSLAVLGGALFLYLAGRSWRARALDDVSSRPDRSG